MQTGRSIVGKTDSFLVDLSKHIELFDLPAATADVIRTSLVAPRDELRMELLSRLLINSSMMKVDCPGEESRSRPETTVKAGMRLTALRVGQAFFVCELAQKDPGLAETLLDFYNGTAVDNSALDERVRIFMEEQRHGAMLPAHQLLVREEVGENSVLSTWVLRGMFKPGFDISDRLGMCPLDRLFQGGNNFKELREGTWPKRDRELIQYVLEAPNPIEPSIVHDPQGDPKLRFIFDNITDSKDILNALDNFVRATKSLSVADLELLTMKIPRGINWGNEDYFDNISSRELKKPELKGKRPKFCSNDLSITLIAMRKTNSEVGINALGRIGKNIQEIVDGSCPIYSMNETNVDPRFNSSLKSFFTNEFAKVVRRLVIDEQ